MSDKATEEIPASGFAGADRPEWQDYSRCTHCGLCLNSCPTYRELGVEMDSPRGRIYQMIAVDQGRLPLGENFVRHMDLCLDCRACETACPSGVEYGRLIEGARAQIEQHYRRPWPERLARRLFFRGLLPSPGALKLAGGLLRWYQASGLRDMVRRSGLLGGFPRLAELETLAPEIDSRSFFRQIGKTFPARGRRRFRVALHSGCIANFAFAELHEATVRVLQENGCEVAVVAGQVCCGALHVHAGLRDEARELARRNIAAFETGQTGHAGQAAQAGHGVHWGDGELPRDASSATVNSDTQNRLRSAAVSREAAGPAMLNRFDAILTNAAGCGSTLREYDYLLKDDAGWRERASQFAARMMDVTTFLAQAGLTQPVGPLPCTVTYQDSCHLLHGQKEREAPRQLLRAIPELRLTELPHSDICCGSAGIYNVSETALAMQLLRTKMEAVNGTGAEIVATANPGCILQLRAGVRLYGRGQQVAHVVELLDRAAGVSTRRSF